MSAGPQIIRSPNGDEMVVLPRAEYERLMANQMLSEDEEDAADVALYDQCMAALEAGEDAVLPADVSAAILKGERLLKALRRRSGLTQQQLAAKTGLGQGYLSALERGERVGSSETREALARALDVPFNWLK